MPTLGGQTIQRFIAAGCLDELILTQVPILLGYGVPLFGYLAGTTSADAHRASVVWLSPVALSLALASIGQLLPS